MDNSFTLLSTMSPKIRNTNRNIVHQKVPTKLALKKNIRRSSILYSLPPTAENKSVILVEDSTTDTTNSVSSYSGLSNINSIPIIISDSDSIESDACACLEKTTATRNHSYKIPNDCGLSESKFIAIDKWVSNVENENATHSSFTKDLHEPITHIAKKKYGFDELINSIKTTFKMQETGNSKKSLEKNQSVDKQTSSNHEGYGNGSVSNMVTSTVKADDSVSSSSDVIEGSDDNATHQNKLDASLLDELYGNNWRNTKNILLPLSEPRYRKKRNNKKVEPKTEFIDRKLKPKWSVVHKNPYLDSEQKLRNTPSTQKEAPLQPLWTRRLQAVCDSDSSDESFNGESQKHHHYPVVRLFFNDEISSRKDRSNNETIQLPKKLDVALEKPIEEKKWDKIAQSINKSIDLEKENFSDLSGDNETLEDRIRRKLRVAENTKYLNCRVTKRKERKALEKPNGYLFEDIQSDNAQHIDKSIDSEKENFSDFSEDSETLEDRLTRKLRLDKKTKFPGSSGTNTKETEDDLKSISNKKCDNFKSTNISVSDISNETDLANDKLLKKTKGPKKKTAAKVTVVKKKLPSEGSGSSGIINNKHNHRSVVSKDSKIHSDNVCKSFLASLSACVPTSQCDPSARIFRNNFKTYKKELVTKLFKLYNEKVFDNAIPEDSLLEWSARMRGTAGYCYCKKITRRTGAIERKVRIVLASKVLDCADRVRDTLIHEMCHAATWIVNEVADGHGNYWKAWAHKAGQIFPELPPIKVCHNYAIATKYTYNCTKCGYSFGRHSKSINVEKKRCGYCFGTFEILINRTTKAGVTKSVPITPKKEVTGFALFVKENYAFYKSPQLAHGQVMKLLGQKFGELKVSVCKDDEEEA